MTERLCEPLEADDFLLQSMPDASPVKWHLAHSTWFFETFVLAPSVSDYQPNNPAYGYLFNSYYEAVGPRWPRPQRGLIARPTVEEVFHYRRHVDAHIRQFISSVDDSSLAAIAPLLLLGLNHEQQHQELIITDLKHAWSLNELSPIYCKWDDETGGPPKRTWHSCFESMVDIGFEGDGFAFDNERPRHQVFAPSFQLASTLVTNAEYIEFIDDGGYDRPELWLSDGWAARQAGQWTAPLYWEVNNGKWTQRTLSGQRVLNLNEPVCHVSFYEADAFARWAEARLPTEVEWEIAAQKHPIAGHFQDAGHFHPSATLADDDRGPFVQMFGDVWQWTSSPYLGYPRYRPAAGAIGEYNGKFMCNQFVLRGASCATPRSHARKTYRNFFPPDARWQFTGIRLAKDLT